MSHRTGSERAATALRGLEIGPFQQEAAALGEAAVDLVLLRREDELDPAVSAGWWARRAPGVGLVVEAAAEVEHPYNLARRIASLDHLSGGRVAWLTGGPDPGRASAWVDSPGLEHVVDAVTAVRRLWRTWPVESFVGDRGTGVYVDSARLRLADHDGLFRTRGPLCVPTTPQGEPTVWWRWAGEPRDLVAAVADVVLVDAADLPTWIGLAGPSVPLVLRSGPGDPAVEPAEVPDLRVVVTTEVPAAAPSGGGTSTVTLRERLGIARRVGPVLDTPAYPGRTAVTA